MTLLLTELSVSQLVDAGIMAFKTSQFKPASTYLLAACDQDPYNWRAKLYLGMSYYKLGDVLLAYGQFRFLSQNCQDQEIRQKAETAMLALNSETKKYMPEMTCTIKKPQLLQKENAGDAQIEWVSQSAM